MRYNIDRERQVSYMPCYRTVLFDADQTLLDFKRSESAALCEALAAMGVAADENMLAKYSEINSAVWKRLERGEITKTELKTVRFAEFCDFYSLPIDATRLAECYLAALATKSFLLDGALEVCRTLASSCRLYIITNGIASVQHGRLDPSPIRPYFQALFISDELGAEKPDKAFFDKVAEKIPDFDPADTLVIGDSLSSDIRGGINAGLDTCWLNPSGAQVPCDMEITYTVKRLEDAIPLVLGA